MIKIETILDADLKRRGSCGTEMGRGSPLPAKMR